MLQAVGGGPFGGPGLALLPAWASGLGPALMRPVPLVWPLHLRGLSVVQHLEKPYWRTGEGSGGWGLAALSEQASFLSIMDN